MMRKFFVIFAIAVMHLLIVYYCLSNSYSRKSLTTEKVILLNLFHDRTEVSQVVEDSRVLKRALSIKNINIKLQMPEIDIQSISVEGAGGNVPEGSVVYDEGMAIFDPRLREKMKNNRSTAIDRADNNFHTWKGQDGTQYVEVGDGDCMTSMPKVANAERGTKWSSSRVKCGKSESERMMENVERNLKHKN
jgi:hypothetical protein